MANRFYSPDQQFLSNSGVPYAGGFLYFYATGTSTPQNTYSDSGLTIANTNPVVLDSNGQAGSVFLQNLSYKVVLTDSNLNQIWTMDPVYTSDYSTFAAFKPWNGNPNGAVAGTAGTQGSLPGTSAVWDYLDNILYVCTTTGSAGTAVWTAVNGTAAVNITPSPQGYLTLSSDPSNPILTGDSTGQTSVYYTPYMGNLVPVYNGATFSVSTFSQLTLALTASQAIATIYDVFVFNNSGVLTLVTGPSWSNSASGSGARGTGGGTTQLQRLGGLWVNAVQISGKNGASTYTIPANTATYLGSISIDSSAGQVSCYRSFGQNRKWGVWNAYNRQTISTQAGDATASWTYNTNTARPSNNNAANSTQVFAGLPEEAAYIAFQQYVQMTPNGGCTTKVGIGFNVTNAFSGTTGQAFVNGLAANGAGSNVTSNAEYTVAPFIGINTLTSVEQTPTTSGTGATYTGTQTSMTLAATYRG